MVCSYCNKREATEGGPVCVACTPQYALDMAINDLTFSVGTISEQECLLTTHDDDTLTMVRDALNLVLSRPNRKKE